jgi:hypothetical protein
MANSSKRIQVSELDFDQIKSNLKNFLKGQSQFSDYDFEGSSMSILLDVLAYNTHYNALYTNLAVNEMFLDSASKRASVVSIAKALGYTPNSARAARATVSATIKNPTSTPNLVTLPQYSPFTTVINGKNFNFYNRNEVSIVVNDGVSYTFNNLELIEGTPLSYKYEVADGQQYIIPNANADVSTLTVRVQDSATSDTFSTFYPATDITTLDATKKVYFIKEIDNGLFELNFGDGLISFPLTNGNIVHLDYFVCNADAPNGARTFSYNGDPLIGSTLTVTTVNIAAGGTLPEEIDSIRFNAPRLYAAQNRAVTPADYKALILGNFPDAASVAVWGGEDNNPPIYGKVYICVKPKLAAKLTVQQKSTITSTLLSAKNVVSITPEIVDPDYINIELNVTVYYNERETTKTASQIETEVLNTILQYNETDLQKFEGVFRFSKLSRLIDLSDQAIINNITTVSLRRMVAPRYNVSAEYQINLVNPIYTSGEPEGALASTGFYIYGSDKVHYLEDDGQGNVVLYYPSAGDNTAVGVGAASTHVVVNPKIGKIDYANGIINIKNLNITSLADVDFEIIIKPQSNDVVSAYTQIAQIDTANIMVNAIADQTVNGDLRAGKNYQFTSSRS